MREPMENNMWRGDFPLDLLDQIQWREEKLEGKRKRKKKRKEKKGEEERSEKLQLLSRFYSDRVVGSCRSKRQSWFTQRELHGGTKISGFH